MRAILTCHSKAIGANTLNTISLHYYELKSNVISLLAIPKFTEENFYLREHKRREKDGERKRELSALRIEERLYLLPIPKRVLLLIYSLEYEQSTQYII